MTTQDLITQGILAVVVISSTSLFYRPLLALSFNADKAQLWGLNPGRAHIALLILIAAAVIGSFQSVGTLLVFGLLVGPPATAALVSRTVPRMMFTAAFIAVFSVWIGLTLSYHLNTAGSATMAIIPVVLFFIVLTVTRLRAVRNKKVAARV